MKISDHLAAIGRRGGKVSSVAKREAARRNIRKRWGHVASNELPVAALEDRHWYFGKGRSGSFGLWDARAKCFWTIAINDFADPALYPEGGERQIRLKQEAHYQTPGGTFRPLAAAHSQR